MAGYTLEEQSELKLSRKLRIRLNQFRVNSLALANSTTCQRRGCKVTTPNVKMHKLALDDWESIAPNITV